MKRARRSMLHTNEAWYVEVCLLRGKGTVRFCVDCGGWGSRSYVHKNLSQVKPWSQLGKVVTMVSSGNT